MVRQLYRFYLYAVYIALLVFWAFGTGSFLNTLFKLTPLRNSYQEPPPHADVVQSLVFAVTTWLVAGALGGLHYWLIRRDLRSDPAATTSAIRSLFLNIPEALAVLFTVVLLGYGVINEIGHSGVSDSLAAALPALVIVVLLELERRRTPVTSGAALNLQRLHFYAVQLLFLFFIASQWFSAFRPLVDSWLFGGRGIHEACSTGVYCPTYYPANLAASLLWFIAWWLVYSRALLTDQGRFARFLLHGFGFAFGVYFVLDGIYICVSYLIAPALGLGLSYKDVLGPSPAYDFVSSLSLGLLIVAAHFLLLRSAARLKVIDADVLRFTEVAIAAVGSSGAFWIGCGSLLYLVLQTVNPVPAAPDSRSWIPAIALFVTGLGSLPLSLYLRRGMINEPVAALGPRRGMVLTLLGGGILALAIGGVIALYNFISFLLGSPVENWQQQVHSGLAPFVIGLLLTVIYVPGVRKEHLLPAKGPQPAPPAAEVAPTPEATPVTSPEAAAQPSLNAEVADPIPVASSTQPTSIETVIDDLLADRVSRAEAIERLRALTEVKL